VQEESLEGGAGKRRKERRRGAGEKLHSCLGMGL
jgi:hypothetical protein